MFSNYFKVALRNIHREKGYAIINVAGLTIGVASCILILLYIVSELTYDRHYENSDRIYRIGIEAYFGDSHFHSAYTSAAMREPMKLELSEVQEAARAYHQVSPLIRQEDRTFIEENFFYVDHDFFDVFSLPLEHGDPATALTRPGTVVISKSTARKYFGDEDPMGRLLNINDRFDLEVTGIFADLPNNTHFPFDFLGSMETIRPDHEGYWHFWTTNNLYTYVLLNEGVDRDVFEEKLQEFVYSYVAAEVELYMGIDIDTFESAGGIYRFFLESLRDIHLLSKSDNQLRPGGNISYVYFFSIIAVFILIIACINFMNMATAKYANRAKEVGIRKVVGSTRGQLIQQFLAESVIISLIAMILAMTLVELMLPWFNQLTGKNLGIQYFNNWIVLPSILLFAAATGILAGSYPAFFLSSFKPVRVLKGEVSAGIKSNKFRKILVVVQFAITISLLVGTFLVNAQLDFWQSRDIGYDKEGLVVLQRTHVLSESQDAFREELLNNSELINASYCTALPGFDFSGSSLHELGAPPENLVQTQILWADEHYLETLGMELKEGRFFSSEFATDADAVIINEPFARAMALQHPTGTSVVFPHQNRVSPILGVLGETNFESLHRSIRPMTIGKIEGYGWLMAIRVDTGNIPAAISAIERTWDKFAGNQPFIYTFLENDLMKLYTQELRTGNIFSIFSLLAVFIACLGLMGMSSFSAEKRTREIGIRKAMGAPVISIYTLLVRETLILVSLATLIAWPASWYIMDNWLGNFAYRINPAPGTFIAGTLIALVIALLTVSYQAGKAAKANPVDSLKYE